MKSQEHDHGAHRGQQSCLDFSGIVIILFLTTSLNGAARPSCLHQDTLATAQVSPAQMHKHHVSHVPCRNQANMSRVMRKPAFCICENKDADQLRGTAKLISAFVFATWIGQSLYFLNPKFQASSHLLWLYSPVCVGTGWKPRRPVFSQRGSYHITMVETANVSSKRQSNMYLLFTMTFGSQCICIIYEDCPSLVSYSCAV